MPDDLLAALDKAFVESASLAGSERRLAAVMPFAVGIEKTTAAARPLRERLPWLDIFVAVQFLWGALLFIPGSQDYRAVIRALPYASSLGLLALYLTASGRHLSPWGLRLLLGAMLLLALNLMHATSQIYAGVAQCIFQLSIAAPLFFAYKAVGSPRRLHRLIVLVFVLNCASAGLGVLQVYFPDRFMPPQFSTLGLQMNDAYVDSQTYVGRDGRDIVRPPGLTDMPGGAAVAGGFAAVLGLALSLRSRRASHLLLTLGAAGIGLAVIYLTQVRSVLLSVIGAIAVLCVVAFRQRRIGVASWIAATGGALLIAAFFWASSVGGESIDERFMSIREQGPLQTFQESRGHFLAHTLGDLLDQFPLGAGVGRWGMMNAYFGDQADVVSPPIYVEIQLTGWLLDGGVLMWFLYGGAILLSALGTFRSTGSRDRAIANAAFAVLGVQVLIVGMGMAGPVFNTQLGIVFWALAAALHGACAHKSAADGSRGIAEGFL